MKFIFTNKPWTEENIKLTHQNQYVYWRIHKVTYTLFVSILRKTRESQ